MGSDIVFSEKCFFTETLTLHSVNPIPTGHGRNQPIYERHVTKSGRNRVKTSKWVQLNFVNKGIITKEYQKRSKNLVSA